MKSLIIFAAIPFLVLSNCVAECEFSSLQIDGKGNNVYLGQSMKEVESQIGTRAVDQDIPIPVLRKGIDMKIDLKQAEIRFDTQRVCGIVFRWDFDYSKIISLFKQEWKGLQPIDGVVLKQGMTKREFRRYLSLWEKRAVANGALKVSRIQQSRTGNAFAINIEDDGDVIEIYFSPLRKGNGGKGTWCDMISTRFIKLEDEDLFGRKAGTLDSISIDCDEFNTRGRHEPAG